MDASACGSAIVGIDVKISAPRKTSFRMVQPSISNIIAEDHPAVGDAAPKSFLSQPGFLSQRGGLGCLACK
jgi:hypothetical protein